jgi:hypothetical protein
MNFKLSDLIICSYFETKETFESNVIVKVNFFLNNYISDITYEFFK